jgi:hypothetical protein
VTESTPYCHNLSNANNQPLEAGLEKITAEKRIHQFYFFFLSPSFQGGSHDIAA